MGCDIHSFAERKLNGKWLKVEEGFIELSEDHKRIYKKEKGNEPFDWRSYSMFAFLANVRNFDCCEPISEPKGWPEDSVFLDSMYERNDIYEDEPMTNKQDIESYAHSWSYLTLKELLDFDYDKTFWDKREEEITSYREKLGREFFKQLEELKQLGEPEDVRVVFWFDS